MNRAPRSTKKQLKTAEKHQTAVITALMTGDKKDEKIAQRLIKCQQERLERISTEYPWRCRSPGCWHCRRTRMKRWWNVFQDWIKGDDTSLAIIPIKGNLIKATRKLRKGLRDVRDRQARTDYRFRSISMAGLINGDGNDYQMMLLIQHTGISRDEVWTVFEGRLPYMTLCDANDIEPSSRMTVEDAASLARNRRGIESLRIVILEQNISADKDYIPMPILF